MLNEWLLQHILPLIFHLTDPYLRIQRRNLPWHQSRKKCVPGIGCGCGQDAEVKVVITEEQLTDNIFHRLPLIQAEIIDEDEEDFFSFVEHGEKMSLK